MRSREMTLEDLGVPKEDQKKLRDYCKNANLEDRLLLFQMAISSAQGLEVMIYESLTTGDGYTRLSKKWYIPAGPDDFYTYQRKTLAAFYRMLKIYGRWDK